MCEIDIYTTAVGVTAYMCLTWQIKCVIAVCAAWTTCHRDRQSEGQRSEPAAFYWLLLVTWPLVLTCS